MTNCSWIAGDYTADYVVMVLILKAQPVNPKVFIMSPPLLYPNNPYKMNQTVVNAVLPLIILPSLLGDATGAESTLIDNFNSMGGANLTIPTIMCGDNVHPNQSGYILLAANI